MGEGAAAGRLSSFRRAVSCFFELPGVLQRRVHLDLVLHFNHAGRAPGSSLRLLLFGPGAHAAAQGDGAAVGRDRDMARIDLGAALQRLLDLRLPSDALTLSLMRMRLITPLAPLTFRTAASAERRWKSQSTSPSSVIHACRTVTLMFCEL